MSNEREESVSRTTYERAVREYDEDFKRELISAIIDAIAKASICTDITTPRIMALRIGETLEALTSCMISFAAMSPHFDTPSNLREFAETLAKRFRREVAKARAKGFCSTTLHPSMIGHHNGWPV